MLPLAPRGSRWTWILLVLACVACGGGEENPEDSDEPPPDPIDVAFFFTHAPIASATQLRRVAGERRLRIRVEVAFHRVDAQTLQIERALDDGARVLLVEPVAPSVLLEAERLCLERGVGLGILGEPSGRPLACLTLPLAPLEELARTAAASFGAERTEPVRVVPTYRPRWPVLRQRTERLVDVVEQERGVVEISARMELVAQDVAGLNARAKKGLTQQRDGELFLAADLLMTETLLDGLATLEPPPSVAVVGVVAEEARRTLASERLAGAYLALIDVDGWVDAAFALAVSLKEDPTSAERHDVPLMPAASMAGAEDGS